MSWQGHGLSPESTKNKKHAMSILQQVLTFMKSMLVQGVVRQQRVHTLVHVLAVTAVKSLLHACLGTAYTVLYVLSKVLETTKKWQRKQASADCSGAKPYKAASGEIQTASGLR